MHSLKLIVSALLLLSVTHGWAAPAPTLLKPDEAAVRIMPFGDSITMGLSTVADGGYRKALQSRLAAGGYHIVYVGKEDDGQQENNTGFSKGMANGNHEGYGSFGINDLLNGATKEGHTAPSIAATLADDGPDIVLLMIGNLVYDGVHATMNGYRKIAAVWYQALTGHVPAP